MGLFAGSGSVFWRGARVLGVAAVGTAVLFLLLILPALWGTFPEPIRRRPVETELFALFAAYWLIRAVADKQTGNDSFARLARFGRSTVERCCAWAVPHGLAIGTACFCVGLLLSWIPHYLTWPWDRDVDTFSTMALGWDLGTAPYRDVKAINFPGHIYLHWGLGKLFGWGRTVPFYAVDASAVVLLGIALAAWSRRILGAMVAGMAAYVAFLSFYLGLEYDLVAQRDWHATLLTALGVMAAESWRGRPGRLAAAVCAGIAFAIRPHIVMLLPAMASAVVEGAEPSDDRPARTTGALVEWALALGLCVIVAFAPLIVAGLVGDLARGVRIAAYGGPFSKATPAGAVAAFIDQFHRRSTDAVLVGCFLIWRFGSKPRRGPARTWLLALLGALVYRPLHPVQHAYLAHPLALIESISLALPVAWLAATPKLGHPARALFIGLILYESMPDLPRFCSPRDSIRALAPLAHGEVPKMSPLGAHRHYLRDAPWVGEYPWEDYRRTLEHLRRATPRLTPVANLLKHPPYPALNGATGHPSPFLVESGLCWMVLVHENLDAEFADSLERTPDAVVVWVPGDIETSLPLERVEAVVRRDYRLDAKFGRIEVWRRRRKGE